jgi:hypothetical protein
MGIGWYQGGTRAPPGSGEGPLVFRMLIVNTEHPP